MIGNDRKPQEKTSYNRLRCIPIDYRPWTNNNFQISTMFLTHNQLGMQYGIDNNLGKFLVDREPPANNLYWHEKELYLRAEPGYIFIPLCLDTFKRLGLSQDQLLNEDYLRLMEKILHIAAQEEWKQLNHSEMIVACETTVKAHTNKNADFLAEVMDYLQNGNNNSIHEHQPPYLALRRGDIFMFSWCALDFSAEQKTEMIKAWMAIIGFLLFLDDVDDMEKDAKEGDPNCVLQAQANNDLDGLKMYIHQQITHIANINKLYATQMEKKIVALNLLPQLQKINYQF